MEFIGHFLLAGVLFAAIDALWIGVVANKFYKKELGGLLRDKPDFVPAVIFYFISVTAMVVFVINPALDLGNDGLGFALGHGALLGLASYAAYDLTNASTLKGWSKAVTVVDLLWGTFVTALVTTVAYLILR